MINKNIFTIWLTENKSHKNNFRPELVQKCLDSQKIEGYTHHIITLDNVDRTSKYVQEALAKKNWVKAADYARMQYLYKNGGLYLDADMEVLSGKNFDDLLDNKMFLALEVAGLYSNAGLGAEKGHPIIKQYLDRVDKNYKGSGDLVFEPGIRTWHDICWAADKKLFTMIDTTVFSPYNHLTNKTNITEQTKVIHHYMKSWVTPQFKELQKEVTTEIEKTSDRTNDPSLKDDGDTKVQPLNKVKTFKNGELCEECGKKLYFGGVKGHAKGCSKKTIITKVKKK